MRKLKFGDFIDTFSQHETLLGEVPPEIRHSAKAVDSTTWLEFEKRLKASGADEELCLAGKRIWRRYRIAARSSLS